MSKEFTSKESETSNTSSKQQIVTFVAFISCVISLPFLILCYIYVWIGKKLWLKLLANRFPHLEFVEDATIRTLLDSHRNQGIMNVLMTVSGACQPLQIKTALNNKIIEKRDARGKYKYPKLRAALVSCWGNYAWRKPIPFGIQNHLIIANASFKGRPISDTNIQDYVSDIISKYLPTQYPPWQIVIIPNIVSEEEKYYILVRVHHLLIAAEEPLSLGDLLLFNSNENNLEQSSMVTTEMITNANSLTSSLSNMIEYPKALSTLYGLLCENLSNKWNEFISEYDPIESPKNLKSSGPSFLHCLAIILIVIVQILKDVINIWILAKTDSTNDFKFYWSIFKREINRRGINIKTIIGSLFKISSIPSSIYAIFTFNYFLFIKLPILCFYEFLALITLKKNSSYPNTYVAFIYDFMPLLQEAKSEIKYWCGIIYKTPISLINEIIFRPDNPEPHQLQTESLCGRKVVAWSDPIPNKTITDIASAAGVTDTEILLMLTKNCLESYFFLSGIRIPDIVLITARTISCDILFTSSKLENSSGILCLSLPMSKLGAETIDEEIFAVKNEIKKVRENQAPIFLIGSKRTFIVEALPSMFARLALNYWFRKFSVLLTEIVDNTNGKLQETQWGHRVDSILCWIPPQGNISMSLTLQRYGDSVRIGVMTDARLLPHHMNAACNWKEAADRLVKHYQISNES